MKYQSIFFFCEKKKKYKRIICLNFYPAQTALMHLYWSHSVLKIPTALEIDVLRNILLIETLAGLCSVFLNPLPT